MFNFSNPDSVSLSKYFWIYWAFTVPLTAAVIVTWRIWTNMTLKKYRKDHGDEEARRHPAPAGPAPGDLAKNNFPLDDAREIPRISVEARVAGPAKRTLLPDRQ
jgi:hypothetical protein